MKKYILFLAVMLLTLSAVTGTALANYEPAKWINDNNNSNSTITHTLELTKSPYTLGYDIVYKFTVTEQGYPIGIWPSTNETYDASGFVSGYPQINDNDKAEYHAGDAFDENHKKETTITVDWSSVTFYEPGVYLWEVTEELDNENTTAPRDNNLEAEQHTYFLWAYVVDDNQDGKLEVHVGTPLSNAININQDTKKDPMRRYPRTTVALTIKKTVSGNQGSRDQYFPFTFDITTSTYAESYTYTTGGDYTKSNTTITSSPYYGNSTVTVNQPGGTVDVGSPFIVWLKDGEYFSILDLPYDCSYSVSETANGYTTTIAVVGDNVYTPSNNNKTVTDQHLTYTQGMTTVTFDNNRDGDIPTGIDLELTAPVIGLILGATLLGFVFVPKRREKSQE